MTALAGIPRDELTAFLDDYLSAKAIRDAAVNGLQVVGKSHVRRIALGVSANLALFDEAARWQADAVLVHHGLLWRDEPRRIDEIVRRRLKILFDHEMNLLAYHLPLDAHPEVGNNIQILRRLGLHPLSPGLSLWEGTPLGVVGQTTAPMPLADFVALVNRLFGGEALALAFGPEQVRKVGIMSGGGASDLAAAIAQRCDVYLTGEAREQTPALCREAGISYLAAGHYNTEKFGILALGDVLRDRLGAEVRFIDIPNDL